jgi:predicted acetyltransferase
MLSKGLRTFWTVLDRVGWMIAIAFLAVGFIIVHSQGVSVNELRVSQLRGCHRLNIVRAEDNRSQLQDFQLFTATADLLDRAIAHPEHPATSQQKTAAESYLARIKDDALGKEWTPLSQCYRATYHPLVYVEPAPVPFARTLPPPDALHLAPGE